MKGLNTRRNDFVFSLAVHFQIVWNGGVRNWERKMGVVGVQGRMVEVPSLNLHSVIFL